MIAHAPLLDFDCFHSPWERRGEIRCQGTSNNRRRPFTLDHAAERVGRRLRVAVAATDDLFEETDAPVHGAGDDEQHFRCKSCKFDYASTQGDCTYCRHWMRPATVKDIRYDLWAKIAASEFIDWTLVTTKPENVKGMLPRSTVRPEIWDWRRNWHGHKLTNVPGLMREKTSLYVIARDETHAAEAAEICRRIADRFRRIFVAHGPDPTEARLLTCSRQLN